MDEMEENAEYLEWLKYIEWLKSCQFRDITEEVRAKFDAQK
jgi:hypothetical protein